MTDNPPTDFDGCHRECRKTGTHTLRWGGCEHATPPEPTVSMSKVYTDTDGYPSIGYDQYTVPQLAELIERGLRTSPFHELRSDDNVNGPLIIKGYLADLARSAAHAIVHRNAAPAVPVPPTTSTADHPSRRAGLRDQLRRAVCEAEGFTWDSDMLEPDEYGDHADTVLAVLYREWPWLRAEAEDAAPADRAAVLREAAETLWNHPRASAIDSDFRGASDVLRRMADETQQPETGRSDVGTEFVHQTDQPDEAGLAAFETDLAGAQQQADTETRGALAVTEAEAERLATLADCPNSRNGALHCDHYQQGDGPCCDCQRPNWCPEGGVA